MALTSRYVHGSDCQAEKTGRFVDCTCNLSNVEAYPDCWVCRNEVDDLRVKLDQIREISNTISGWRSR